MVETIGRNFKQKQLNPKQKYQRGDATSMLPLIDRNNACVFCKSLQTLIIMHVSSVSFLFAVSRAAGIWPSTTKELPPCAAVQKKIVHNMRNLKPSSTNVRIRQKRRWPKRRTWIYLTFSRKCFGHPRDTVGWSSLPNQPPLYGLHTYPGNIERMWLAGASASHATHSILSTETPPSWLTIHTQSPSSDEFSAPLNQKLRK